MNLPLVKLLLIYFVIALNALYFPMAFFALWTDLRKLRARKKAAYEKAQH